MSKVKTEMAKIAKSLKSYQNLVDRFLIIETMTDKQYEECMRSIDKIRKKLKKGNYEGIIDTDEFNKSIDNDDAFAQNYGGCGYLD